MYIKSDIDWEVAEKYHLAYEALREHYSVRRSIEIIMEGKVRESLLEADNTVFDVEYAVIKDASVDQ